jgi:hypothetical protein
MGRQNEFKSTTRHPSIKESFSVSATRTDTLHYKPIRILPIPGPFTGPQCSSVRIKIADLRVAISEPDARGVTGIIPSSLVGAKIDDAAEFLNAFIPGHCDVHWVRDAGHLFNPVTVPQGWESAAERDNGRFRRSFKSRYRISVNSADRNPERGRERQAGKTYK